MKSKEAIELRNKVYAIIERNSEKVYLEGVSAGICPRRCELDIVEYEALMDVLFPIKEEKYEGVLQSNS